MNSQPTQRTAAAVPAFEEPQVGVYVYLCERCGRSMGRTTCATARHVGTDGLGTGHAVRSTELARLAGAACAGLGGGR
jgi:hypothetical protein